ncbi:capsular biosynthesis protein [Rodentibacter trehalosifermentans]|uniref:Capsular biosynthesis protein n=1 Tax=Rodentibacter trehalosifermentans TaxID=1908263 RepID=A0A1V3ITK4_9PAST|nr:capsular biosynthesis protein [Rodentibacter trehalosifermentans]OOF45503.1 capsular biosynthesis protein [Rodentibacter trehalosifermentans]
MNFLILVNNAPRYKYFYNQIAKELESLGHAVYYAIDSIRSIYLEPIAEIDNNKNSYFFNQYLKENFLTSESIAPKSGDKKEFWGDIFYSDFDRFLVHNYNLERNTHYWINVKQNLDKFFEKIIIENNIDCILYENVSNTFAYMAYKKAIELNKKYIGLIMSRIPNYFEIQNSIIDLEVSKIISLAKQTHSEEDKAWFENYKKNISSIQPDYMKSNGLDNVSPLRLLKLQKLKKLYGFFMLGFKYDYKYDFQFGNPFKFIFAEVVKNISRYKNTKLSNRYYLSKIELDKCIKEDNFYIYPIHYHPESSTSVLAPEYTNEYVNIINISNNLPYGTYLYVKDHKSAKGVQSLAFYRKISSLPNVKLINYDVNIKELIIHSKGVITVNSTAGYEALLLEKPVFILGRVFYECFPNVMKLSNFRDIRLINDIKFSQDVAKYFIAYKNYCKKGNIIIKQSYDDKDAKNIKTITKEIVLNAQG